MRQTAWLVYDPIIADSYAALLSCTAMVQVSDSFTKFNVRISPTFCEQYIFYAKVGAKFVLKCAAKNETWLSNKNVLHKNIFE